MTLATKVDSLRHEARRVGQTTRTFDNWRGLLRVGARPGVAEVVSRVVAVGAVAVAGSNLLHSSPLSPNPGVGVGSVSLRGAVLHRAGISLIVERSQNVKVGVVMVDAWTGYTGVMGRLWAFLLAVFHGKTGPDLRRTYHGTAR